MYDNTERLFLTERKAGIPLLVRHVLVELSGISDLCFAGVGTPNFERLLALFLVL